MDTITQPQQEAQAPAATIGERVRELRAARGLTQSELAGERFTKEYVSQIERGKTRPTVQTLEWLADRLGADRQYLETGVSEGDRIRAESVIAQAEAAIEANRYEEAAVLVKGLEPPSEELRMRALLVESWARMYLGGIRKAIALAEEARQIADAPRYSDLDRAEVLFRLGCCRYKLSSISTALALYCEALKLAEASGLPCDRLRSHILGWRSRCYRRQRDFEAAREDIERALELAQGLGDKETIAHTFFQASLVAERQGHWVRARSYAERAKAVYEEIADRQSVGRLLNNLGGLSFLLGKPDQAKEYLKSAFAHALEIGSTADAAQAVSSLAQVHLRTGEVVLAEQQARHALELLDGRVDFLDEIGNAQLVLGRALLEQARLDEAEEMFALAESSFEQLSSESHRAAAWIAHGDLATRRGDDRAAARLYRRAAEALQDFRF
jgi:transcriptional regulator with XRE-family HTH domain/Tfp pilus assembly protein PilF